MRCSYKYQLNNHHQFKEKLINWAGTHNPAVILDSHDFNKAKQTNSYPYLNYDCIIAVSGSTIELNDGSVFNDLKTTFKKKPDWLFGYLSYDLKNETERLSSNNTDGLNLPESSFFTPKLVFILNESLLEIQYFAHDYSEPDLKQIIDSIEAFKTQDIRTTSIIDMQQRVSKLEYMTDVTNIIKHIQLGDIYELNYCMEFYNNEIEFDSFETYQKLMALSPTPFSAYYCNKNVNLMSASPERFLQKEGSRLVSQPIKGTIKRGISTEEDDLLKNQLRNDPKEIAENVMIVDLVRNDLSRSAKRKSVTVEELCGIYSFQQVHQMISTISCELNPSVHFIDAIKNAFPMGSMTGAPKIRAMELIEQYEHSKRGLYSGAVGYISPEGNFDFNVVIRSLIYNSSNKYLSYSVGGAITAKSKPEQEYEECLLKAKAMAQTLSR